MLRSQRTRSADNLTDLFSECMENGVEARRPTVGETMGLRRKEGRDIGEKGRGRGCLEEGIFYICLIDKRV